MLENNKLQQQQKTIWKDAFVGCPKITSSKSGY